MHILGSYEDTSLVKAKSGAGHQIRARGSLDAVLLDT